MYTHVFSFKSRAPKKQTKLSNSSLKLLDYSTTKTYRNKIAQVDSNYSTNIYAFLKYSDLTMLEFKACNASTIHEILVAASRPLITRSRF